MVTSNIYIYIYMYIYIYLYIYIYIYIYLNNIPRMIYRVMYQSLMEVFEKDKLFL